MELNNLTIAHRGIHDNIKVPENSIPAFREALKYNYPIELDVQLTRDNILVVFHDKSLKRMTGVNKLLETLTYDKLKELNLLNTKEHIPTLKEVLKLVNGKVLLDIEIKTTSKIDDVCRILSKELEGYNNIIVKSFDYKIIKWFKYNNPNIKRGLLLNNNKHNIFKLISCKPNFLAISKNLKIKSYYKNFPILLWTIKEKKEMDKYKLITNNYICNNIKDFIK